MLNGATIRLRSAQANKARPTSQRIVAPSDIFLDLASEKEELSGIRGLLSGRMLKVKRNGGGLKRGWHLPLAVLRGQR